MNYDLIGRDDRGVGIGRIDGYKSVWKSKRLWNCILNNYAKHKYYICVISLKEVKNNNQERC